jgi:hypothetical protein
VLLEPDYQFVHHRPRTMRPGENEQMIRDQFEYHRYLAMGPNG